MQSNFYILTRSTSDTERQFILHLVWSNDKADTVKGASSHMVVGRVA